ncbi:MAG: sterol desaturase family protein [Elusimicrobiota bacterium]
MISTKSTAPRRSLSFIISASLAVCSVEPAFSQVRVVAAESAGSPVGRIALPRISALAPAAFDGSLGLSLGGLAAPLAGAPALSAGLPASAAAPAALTAIPSAAANRPAPADEASNAASAEAPAPASAEAAGISPHSARPASSEERGAYAASLETLASSVQSAPRFFDQAGRRGPSAQTVLEAQGAAFSGLEPNDPESNDRSRAAKPATPPSPGKTRSIVGKILWGAGALALPVITFGWMSFLKSPAPAAGAEASPYGDWSAIARGVAVMGPLVALMGWEALKFYRSKKQDALAWVDRVREGRAIHKPFLPRLNHYMTNLAFGAVGIAMMAIFAGPHINDWNHFLDVHSIGLLHWLHVGGWKNVVASITILDFMGWWWHYACHRFPLMWRLHKVHHSDIEYNFSTTYRTHWAEMAAEIAGRMTMYALVGPTLLAITIYELIILILSQYQHANIKMPERVENFLSRFFMTSHKHYIHHSMDQDDYDTNYGFIFAAWDKWFKTFKNYDPDHLSNHMTTGIREYPRAQDLTFFKLLWMPFRSQKPSTSEKNK